MNLVAIHSDLRGDGLFLGDAAAQVGSDILDLVGVEPITTLEGATAALDIIVEQGEGSPADREESHYRSFLAIREELDELTSADEEFAPAWPVADSPVLRQPPDPEAKVFIDNPEAAKLLDFACATYGLLLRCLVQCFGRSVGEGAAPQKALMSAAIDLMHVLGDASTALARLPASRVGSGINAGMSFTMLRGVEPLIAGAVEKRLLQERARALLSASTKGNAKVRAALERAFTGLSGLKG